MRRSIRDCFKNKKGNMIADSLTTFILVLVFTIFAVIGIIIHNNFNDAWQQDEDIPQDLKNDFQVRTNEYSSVVDNIAVMIFFVSMIVSILLSFLIDSHPVFFFISLMFFIAVVIVIAASANGVVDVLDDPLMDEYTDDLNGINFLWKNMLVIMIVYATILGIILYGKAQ